MSSVPYVTLADLEHAALRAEPTGETTLPPCACCGTQTRRVWGHVYRAEAPAAAYFVEWTDGHVRQYGARWDIVLGAWGDGTSPDDRHAARLVYRLTDEGPAFMVVDADATHRDMSAIAARSLRRSEVMESAIRTDLLAICDAVYVQDTRLAILWPTDVQPAATSPD